MVKFVVGLSRLEDLDLLGGIESRAGALFLAHPVTRDLGLDMEAARDFGEAHAAGLLWVARDAAGVPLGFALVEALEAGWHLEEIDVDPAFGRRGIGAALVGAVCAAAGTRGVGRVTLCTFREVPWNAPFYARLGFVAVAAGDLSPTLRARIAAEAARGLPVESRVAMCWEAPV